MNAITSEQAKTAADIAEVATMLKKLGRFTEAHHVAKLAYNLLVEVDQSSESPDRPMTAIEALCFVIAARPEHNFSFIDLTLDWESCMESGMPFPVLDERQIRSTLRNHRDVFREVREQRGGFRWALADGWAFRVDHPWLKRFKPQDSEAQR